ncbi:hypothetical protein R70006_06301 [Paraburkholderia domus]|uniref:hypothetical protein n=1 Tax=Paraburkholderia domus TaxID=2793075 RepID=UPI0019119752|nr:hypothetical protein [Paraburkholderia domus]MBK5052929.1 hypothetical protein [Burkholderia sp. R-70006]CAE6823112.1 hypothetical protein R70006_06301 [Paraburkholderia domus]
MKSLGGLAGFLFLGGMLGVAVGMRNNAVESLMPLWYQQYGDQALMVLGILAVYLNRRVPTTALVVCCLSIVIAWAMPVMLAIAAAGMHPPGYAPAVLAAVTLLIPVLYICKPLIDRVGSKQRQRGAG